MSVERYNQKIEQPIPTEKLLKDVDYVQSKLERLHPNLYKYISRDKLNAKFDSIRNEIKVPMTSKDFYFLMSPVIASVRQGHMILFAPVMKMTKKEQKRLLKSGTGPLSQFDFEWINYKLYVVKNRSLQKTIIAGAEVISINRVSPQKIYNKYHDNFASDGFNTTYISRGFSKRFSNYLTSEIGINDSLRYVFKQNDSLKEFVIHRLSKQKKNTQSPIDKVVAADNKIAISKRYKRIYGYDKTTKLFSKNLNFFKTDSSVAVLKIRDFSNGKFCKAYHDIFEKLYKNNTKTLIIDLRNNPGGRVNDVVNLYSYLTDKDFIMLQDAEVTSKTSLWKLGIFNKMPLVTYPILAVFYPGYMMFSSIKTKKHDDGTYTYSLEGSKKKTCSPYNFKGKIYVIINGGSFSASCLLAASLKANKNVTFVGEETGGGFNSTVAGILPVLTLPNSKLPLRLGLMDIKTINQTEVFGHGIFPDKEIIPTLKDKMDNKDPETEWIMNEIKSKNN